MLATVSLCPRGVWFHVGFCTGAGAQVGRSPHLVDEMIDRIEADQACRDEVDGDD